MQQKICRGCKRIKPISDFYKKKAGKYGVDSQCSICKRKARATYYADNTSKTKQWYVENRERVIKNKNENKMKHWEHSMWLTAKHNAIKMGREFSIDISDIIIPLKCPYLGFPLTKILGKGRIGSNPSLDRIDSSRGYIKGNVRVVSDKANRIKMDLTREELLTLANNIIKLCQES